MKMADIDTSYLDEDTDSIKAARPALLDVVQRFNTLLSQIGSSLVGFIQGGTGAIKRSVQDKLKETVSVKDFGAVGNGVVNDTSSFQAALDYIRTSSKSSTLFIPSGSYLISSTLTYNTTDLTKSLTIVGEDGIRSLINFNGTGDCLSFSLGQNALQTTNRLVIKNLSLKTSAVSGSAIRVTRTASAVVAPNSLFEDVYIFQEGSGYWTYGIRTADSSDQWFNRCYLMHFGTSTTSCIFIENNLTTQSLYGAYFNGCSFNGGTYCLRSTGQLESVYINNCSMVGALDVISLDATGTTFGNPHLTIMGSHINCKRSSINTTKWRAITITGTDVYSGVGTGDVAGQNINITNSQHVCITGCKLENGAVSQSRSLIQLTDVTDFSITGCVLSNATASGISILGSSGRGIVSNNTISGYVDGTVNNEGVYHVGTGEGNVFSGNNIYYFSKGITINSNANVITGNVFQSVTTGIEVAGGADNYAKCNTFRDVTSEVSGAIHKELFRSVTIDPASVAAGARTTQLVTVQGVLAGDFIDFSAPYDMVDLTVTCYAQNTNTVALNIKNDTGSVKDLASGVWKFRVHS
jgi:parallel beta-helix repeat protein